jgi:hypothetical protein
MTAGRTLRVRPESLLEGVIASTDIPTAIAENLRDPCGLG